MSVFDYLERHDAPEEVTHFRNCFVFKPNAKEYPIEYIMRTAMNLKEEDNCPTPWGGVYVIQSRTNPAYAITYNEAPGGNKDCWYVTTLRFRSLRTMHKGATWEDAWKVASYDDVREFIEEQLKTL